MTTISYTTAQAIILNQKDIFDILTDKVEVEPGEAMVLQQMYEKISDDYRLSATDAYESIINIMFKQIERVYG
jgi:hypothetical protein